MCSPSSYVGWTDFDACVYQARISGAGLFQWTPGEDEGGCKLCPSGIDGLLAGLAQGAPVSPYRIFLGGGGPAFPPSAREAPRYFARAVIS